MMLLEMQKLIVFLCLLTIAHGQRQPITDLPLEEVDALREIAATLGKNNWNFTVDPCGGSSGWADRNVEKPDNALTCNCNLTNNRTVCHVTSIILKGQNLNGSVPRELARLPFLQEIDLTRNYLNGTIPLEWGSLQLVNVSLLGNRITGPIPKQLGNISTLANLTLEYNQLSGPIPPELGNLSHIEKLVLMSNNLSGELPEELANLATLKDFRISDNNFTGQIPSFISRWTNIERLFIQGTGMSGPIPPAIASLTKLTDLRISDLSGDGWEFPPLSNRTKFKNLILRNCNITGQLPDGLGDTTGLKVLDLSFNKFSGPIPDSYSQLSGVDFIYLTGNSLSGRVPDWMENDGEKIDLSFNNNLTSVKNAQNCQPRESNLFASSKGNTTGIVSCLGISSCDNRYTELYINCGGNQAVDERKTYQEDKDSDGPSNFRRRNGANWGYSSTGNFLDDDRTDTFIGSNTSTISGQNPELCKDARFSPLSLTYYAFCFVNGHYTVNLHFAEIKFTNDSTFSSLGRRVFDVYIQGKLVLKDFNIANEAGGVNIGIKRAFPVVVDDGTMDIRFFWAGKGTNGIPSRGIYGPLISAISIKSDFKPPGEKSISAGAVVGIVVAVLFAIFFILGILWWKGCIGRKDTMLHDLKGLDLHTGIFSLRQIKAATNDFDPANKIGEGGFGPVYKGHLSDGTIIAVKQLSSKSKQGNREFVNEIGMISALQHPHLVKLYGCCIEGNQLLLIYEYLENNSLARALFGPEEYQLHLDWPTRHKICIGIARGLAYLHEESRLKIVHRDIKATNVLLDKDLVPKISDFGLAKLDEEDNTHMSTRVAGTYGYMAPEYAMRGHLTDKADVYSFGVVLLEIVCGRSNTSIKPKEAPFYLLDWANSLKENGNFLELIDPRLESKYNKKQVVTAINLALQCTSVVSTERPSMSTVVSILEGKDNTFEYSSGSSAPNEKMNKKAMSIGSGEEQSERTDVAWTGSSASTGDLYPILMNTDYWQKRDL